MWGATVLGNYTITPSLTLNAIGAFRRFDSDEAFDADGTAAPALRFNEIARGDQWSQELRLSYDGGGRFSGFGGVSGFREEGSQRVPFVTDERSLFLLAVNAPAVRQALAAAGVPEGTTMTMLCTPEGYVNEEQICQAAVAMWARIGLKVTLQLSPRAVATQRRVARGVAAVLAEDGATLDGYRLLRSLAGGPGRSMGELVAALHLPAPTLTRLVDAAVDAALVYRLPDPHDGRKVVVHLSEPGRARLARLEALVAAHEPPSPAPGEDGADTMGAAA